MGYKYFSLIVINLPITEEIILSDYILPYEVGIKEEKFTKSIKLDLNLKLKCPKKIKGILKNKLEILNFGKHLVLFLKEDKIAQEELLEFKKEFNY